MKKLFAFILFASLVSFSAWADNRDRAEKIAVNDLPQNIRTFITKHFGNASSIESAYKWPRNYSVYLYAGHKVSFYTDGSLKEADASNNALPKSILTEFSPQISNYVNTNYPDWELTDIEVKRSKIEIELESGRRSVDLEFSKTGELLDVDLDD
ncbi:MAG TPA: hypothetical protein DIT04_01495 [Dysgonomonas sp.]|nr:hypothetical protein [Dysgonomonas sp.]